MESSDPAKPTRGPWSTRKKDEAPRGVYRHPSGAWAVRFTCGAGHIHKERVGRLKEEAKDTYNKRRSRGKSEPGWCPAVEARRERERAQAEAAREQAEAARQQARVTFRDYATDYLTWARAQGKRSWMKDESRLNFLLPVFGDRLLDEITTAEVERFLDSLEGRAGATVNRYRDQLSGMFKRAVRLALIERNPVTGIPKRKEAGGRVVFVLESEEAAIRDALPEVLKPLFTISIHTGLRWSEQAGLHWRDVDVLTGLITVRLSKNGACRQVPMNATARAALMELAMRRQQTDNPEEPVTGISYRHMNRLFLRAVERAKQALRDAGADATRLGGYTWHGNRHSFASRLVMAGVDPLTLQKLGGWKTLSMVQRYSHLSPGHLRAAVELLDSSRAADVVPASQLARNLTGAAAVTAPERADA